MRRDAPLSAEFEVLRGAQVVNTRGRLGLTFIDVRMPQGERRTIECGALGVSGGWSLSLRIQHKRSRRRKRAEVKAQYGQGIAVKRKACSAA